MKKTEFLSYLEHLQNEGRIHLNQNYQTDLENNYTIGYKQSVKISNLIGGFLIILSIIGYLYLTISPLNNGILGIFFLISSLILVYFQRFLLLDCIGSFAYLCGTILCCFFLMQDINFYYIDVILILLIIINFFVLYFLQRPLFSLIVSSIIAACLILLFPIFSLCVPFTIGCCIWTIREPQITTTLPKLSSIYSPIRISLFLAAIFTSTIHIITPKYDYLSQPFEHTALYLTVIEIYFLFLQKAALCLTVIGIYFLFSQKVDKKNTIEAIVCTLGIFVIAYFSVYIACLLLLLFVSFKRAFKIGISLSIVGLIFHTSWLYYSLHISLLAKSISMIIIGLLLLTSYVIILKTKGHEKN